MLMIWPILVSLIVNENTFSGSIASADASHNHGEGLFRPVFYIQTKGARTNFGLMALTVGFFKHGQSMSVMRICNTVQECKSMLLI